MKSTSLHRALLAMGFHYYALHQMVWCGRCNWISIGGNPYWDILIFSKATWNTSSAQGMDDILGKLCFIYMESPMVLIYKNAISIKMIISKIYSDQIWSTESSISYNSLTNANRFLYTHTYVEMISLIAHFYSTHKYLKPKATSPESIYSLC